MFVCCATSRQFASQGFIYDTTVGLSQFNFFFFTLLLPFLQKIKLPFVVFMYISLQHCTNNYVQLLTTSCVFSSIVHSYVIQGQGVARHYYDCQCHKFQGVINILTGNTKYQGIDGCFCDNVVYPEYPDILQSRMDYQVIPS